MFKKIAMAVAFAGALTVGSLATTEAQAWHHRHYHGPPGGYYGAHNVQRIYHHGPYAHRSHIRSVYYGGPRYYGPRYGARYGGYYGGPAVRLSIGF